MMKRILKFVLIITCSCMTILILKYFDLLSFEIENEINISKEKKLISFGWTQRWGLGNEMYALASTIGINKMLNSSRIVCFNRRVKIRKLFDLARYPPCRTDFLIENMNAVTYHEVGYARFDPQVEFIPNNLNVVLDRFFQSWKYFRSVKTIIRDVFRFSKETSEEALNVMKNALPVSWAGINYDLNRVVKIGVHVRRKDLDLKNIVELGYTTAPKEYFERAFKYFIKLLADKKFIFIICSDDLEWSKDNLKDLTEHISFISYSDSFLDLAILASCDHSIISVGTYGWWGAWLANGVTVYYKDWPLPGSQLYASTSHDDYFLEHWIPM